jgi:hypothetical protein
LLLALGYDWCCKIARPRSYAAATMPPPQKPKNAKSDLTFIDKPAFENTYFDQRLHEVKCAKIENSAASWFSNVIWLYC